MAPPQDCVHVGFREVRFGFRNYPFGMQRRKAVIDAQVDLFRALGGGWQKSAPS